MSHAMSEEDRKETLRLWLESRPESVQKLAAEFPMGSTFDVPGKGKFWLLGYNEEDMLIVSRVDPCEDWIKANEGREYLCASHCRQRL